MIKTFIGNGGSATFSTAGIRYPYALPVTNIDETGFWCAARLPSAALFATNPLVRQPPAMSALGVRG